MQEQHSDTSTPEGYLTIPEAMAYAGVSRNTFDKYRKALEEPVEKPGIGSKSHLVSRQVAESIRLLKANPHLLNALKRSARRDAIRDATLALIQVLIPDEQWDPVADPRQEQAIARLGALLDSVPAAEGIAQALTFLLAQNPLITVVFSTANTDKEQDLE